MSVQASEMGMLRATGEFAEMKSEREKKAQTLNDHRVKMKAYVLSHKVYIHMARE